ncbi:helix-turn-helix transcriptional regulator [Mucilaginibacter sp. cycad4]|uniref:helix-turn-helix domain-containing protein n=1 Tax=Mucilaginibacter sp. cycad4 TaxID=3342096 RepID=UPI002AAB3F6A|nr:helix-turn-helix transcriptional regulator [Mucilaginibacter gossypii]WPV02143.1 helix-turn-helix transcriptional regulator [Mucilaginibacter gossypii]
MNKLIFGTQIEEITAIFIILEFCMFLLQLSVYALRPQDKNRGWFLLLLFLMLLYNITGGLFPDPKINIPVSIQEMIAYGAGFLMASYFPFYFYKAFDLKSLRWHALFGVPLFLALPYLIFFVIIYTINGKLDVDIRYGMIVPFIYALVLLYVMLRAIRQKYGENRNRQEYIEEIAMYCAISPWAALAFFGLVEESQFIEVLCTNTGIVIITLLFLTKSVRKARQEFNKIQNESPIDSMAQKEFVANCLHFGLTRMETLVVQWIYKGKSSKEIADFLYISEDTVKKHIQNSFRKVEVKNRVGLIHKLLNR